MKGLKLLLITLTYTLFFSAFQINHEIQSIEILRYSIGKTGFQSIEIKNSILSKWMKNKTPLVMRINDYQKYELNGILAKFDFDTFKSNLDNIPEVAYDAYPRIYYRFIIEGDTIQTKDFLQKDMPEEIKNLDKLLLKYTASEFKY